MLKTAYILAFLVLGCLILAWPYLPGPVTLADEAAACDDPGVYRVELADITSPISDPFSGEVICPIGFQMQNILVVLRPGQTPPESPRCVRNVRKIECGRSSNPARRITIP